VTAELLKKWERQLTRYKPIHVLIAKTEQSLFCQLVKCRRLTYNPSILETNECHSLMISIWEVLYSSPTDWLFWGMLWFSSILLVCFSESTLWQAMISSFILLHTLWWNSYKDGFYSNAKPDKNVQIYSYLQSFCVMLVDLTPSLFGNNNFRYGPALTSSVYRANDRGSPFTRWRTITCKLQNMRLRGPLEKFVDWRQCTAVTQREAVTVMPSCSSGGNVAVAWSSSL
jgi:hypothetical protein